MRRIPMRVWVAMSVTWTRKARPSVSATAHLSLLGCPFLKGCRERDTRLDEIHMLGYMTR